jgi:hypothetical protein
MGCGTLLKTDRFTAFFFADVKLVQPVSINAFRIYEETRFENAVFSQKFTPWVGMYSISILTTDDTAIGVHCLSVSTDTDFTACTDGVVFGVHRRSDGTYTGCINSTDGVVLLRVG